jgi:hypothetical protein
MPSKGTINLYQGDDAGIIVSVFNENGTPADLTGYTAQAQIRRGPADVDPIVVAAFTATVDSPVVNLTLTHSETESLTGNYLFDLQLVSEGGVITTIMTGPVRVTAEVTRAA